MLGKCRHGVVFKYECIECAILHAESALKWAESVAARERLILNELHAKRAANTTPPTTGADPL
jgi:hypothetical protein